VSKPVVFGLIFGWIFMLTLLVNSMVAFDATTGLTVSDSLTAFSADSDASGVSQIFALSRTFWHLLTFRITGLPTIFSLFALIPTVINGFMLVQIIRGV